MMRWVLLALALCIGTARAQVPQVAAPPCYQGAACTIVGGNVTAQVPTNGALKALPTGAYSVVYRAGYSAAGDGGAAVYTWSGSACSLNAGAGDNGSQVRPNTGAGCWIANLTATPITPMIFGAAGNGTTDDTSIVQAAVNATAAAGVPLIVSDATHKYLVSSALVSTSIVDIEGFAPVGNDGISNAQLCPSGIIVNSDINVFAFTGPKVTIRGVCIQMTPGTSVSRVSGAAILLGGSDQQNDDIEWNTIYRPYDGIQVGGASSNNLARNAVVSNNTVRDPVRYGYAVGMGTYGGATAGITMKNNTVGCDAGYNTNGIGFAFFDGAVKWDGTTVGPNNCYIGTEIIPGSIGSNGQSLNGEFTGVLGDSSGTHYTGAGTPHDLYIEPQTSAAQIQFLSFTQAWAGGVIAGDNEILIRNSNGGACSNISFTNLTAHSGPSQTVPIVDWEGCFNVTITGSKIDAWNSGTVSGAGLQIGASAARGAITGNHIGQEGSATLSTGLSVNGGAAFLTITGNELTLPTTPISFTPGSDTQRILFANNAGVDDLCPSVASAATIAFPNASSCVHLTGTTTITSLLGAWDNRQVTVIADSGLSLNIGGANHGICSADLTLAATAAAKLMWNSPNGCWVHVP